jgi:hypothetical protein
VDRVVLVLFLIGAIAGIFFEPLERVACRQLDPARLARLRWSDEISSVGLFSEELSTAFPRFWLDERGETRPFRPLDKMIEVPADRPRPRDLVFRSSPEVPSDPWGNPWVLRLAWRQGQEIWYCWEGEIFSAGPDGRFEDGNGDDISIAPQNALPPRYGGPRGAPLVLVVLVAGWVYLAGRQWTRPPSSRVELELARAFLASVTLAAPLGSLCSGVLPKSMYSPVLLAPRYLATAGTLTVVGTLVLFWVRGRRAPRES